MSRKIISALSCLISVIGISAGFMNIMANVGAMINPDGLPMDPVAPWFLVGAMGMITAMVVWPHEGGLWNYLKKIF